MDLASGTTMDLASGSTLTIDSVTNRTTATTNIALQIGGNTRIDIVDATVTINPTGTITNQINGTAKQTISSTLITNTNPTVNSGLTYPISTTTALGYYTSTTSATKFTASNANMASLSIPGAGCWLVEGNFQFGTVFLAQAFTFLSLSTTSATLDSTRIMVLAQANQAGDYGNRLTSIFNTTGATTVYLVGRTQTALGGTNTQSNFMSATKIA
jgi:hypothetical protein